MKDYIDCTCGLRNWQWGLDSLMRSWIKCENCGDSMFEPGVGVVLINWDFTDLDKWTLKDVLGANKEGHGIVGD
jgi:hypothetical protein